MTEFVEFPKMARLSREAIVTEKIDGTNASIYVGDDGLFLAGSRTRWITPEDDNFGFAKWAQANMQDLLLLGPGLHFGEWWGSGIQRSYGLKERRFSLFNAVRWCAYGSEPKQIPTGDPRVVKMQSVAPACCHIVPILYRGMFTTEACDIALASLAANGSRAVQGFMQPEGIVAFHIAGGVGFKKTIESDGERKTKHQPTNQPTNQTTQ